MVMANSRNLVSAEWLLQHADDPDVRVIDGSWYLPHQGRDARAEYSAGHIPGAMFFDLDEHSDHTSDLPHMMPTPEAFSEAVAALGVSNSDHVVVYDGLGFMSAPRIWWMFKAFGHERVSVLDGGMPAWKRASGPVTDDVAQINAGIYQAVLNPDFVSDRTEMLGLIGSGTRQIVDARSSERFAGRAPEPRKGIKSGHMPAAKNLPFQKLVSENGLFESSTKIQEVFQDAGVDLSLPVVTTCGSGVTAAILTLGLTEIGHSDTKLYDGSWAEWASHPETSNKIESMT
jgi:thiosulfate/3-mercaptopyruvate sulfurtransferase